MRHIQGVFVAVRGETNGSGGQQYREHSVAQDPSLWHTGMAENCKLGDQFTSPVSQVAIRKSLAHMIEPAEVAIHFLQDFDWHEATAIRVKIYVNDRCSGKVLQVDLPKHSLDREPFVVHKLPRLPPTRKPDTTSSLHWKMWNHGADQGSITVFVARGKWVESPDQSIEARRKTRETMGLSGSAKLPTATRFVRLANNKFGTWLCFEFQVQPKDYIFAPVVEPGDKGATHAQEQQSQPLNSLAQKSQPFKASSHSVPGAASPPSVTHRTTVATPKPTSETSFIAPSSIESQGRTVQKPITTATAASNSHADPFAKTSKTSTTPPKAGRKRTASVADLNATAPVSASGQSHDTGGSPAGELRSRPKPACVSADSSSAAGPLDSANTSFSLQRKKRATVIDLTDDDVAIKTEAVPQTSTIERHEAQETYDEDEQDLQLELRAIRIEQRLRSLLKQKQKGKQVKVKMEEL